MRRMENDLLFFHELIGNCSVEKDSKIYTISPKFGKGTMQSFEVMPGAEIVYSNVHITTPIQKNIQCIDRFIEVTYCFHGRVNMLFSDQPGRSGRPAKSLWRPRSSAMHLRSFSTNRAPSPTMPCWMQRTISPTRRRRCKAPQLISSPPTTPTAGPCSTAF